MVNMVQECFRIGKIDRIINKTFICLIPKVKHSSNFNHFRLISLCNFSYKVVAKILDQRLRKLLDVIISPNQGSFVSGLWIVENTVIA